MLTQPDKQPRLHRLNLCLFDREARFQFCQSRPRWIEEPLRQPQYSRRRHALMLSCASIQILRQEGVTSSDAGYLQLIVSKIEVCKAYWPKFGQGERVSFEEFQALYGGDQFYSWFGLDHPLMYAAHKAAGGITSLYRQIGIGCEQLFRRVLQDHLELTPEQANWSYTIPVPGKKDRKLSLDGDETARRPYV